MCKILCVVYFSLFFGNLVESYNANMQDGLTEEDVKLSKHHHHHRARLTVNNELRKTNDGSTESNPSTTEKPISIIKEKNTERLVTDDKFVNSEEPTHENTTEEFERTAYTPNIISLDSLTKTQRIRADESSSDDYSDSDADTENIEVENVNSPADDVEHDNDTGEEVVFLNTPNKETLSQDAVLDLKARSGRIQPDEGDLNYSDVSNVSEIGSFPQHDNTLRSGYIPPDNVDVLNPPKYVQNAVIAHNRPMSPHSSDHTSQFKQPYNPNNHRPEMLYNAQNYRPRYSPLYFESINSREMLYPTLNHHEMWAQGNSGQRTKSYFGSTNPSNQMYTRYQDRCPKCTQGRDSSRERSFRRSVDENFNVLETANGRSVEFDPLGANAYPLAQDNDVELVNRLQAAPNKNFNPGSRDAYASQEVERNVQSDPGPFSKVLLSLPSYVPRSGSLMRRVGLGGLQRFDMNKWLV